MNHALTKYLNSIRAMERTAAQIQLEVNDQEREQAFTRWAWTFLPLLTLAALIVGLMIGTQV